MGRKTVVDVAPPPHLLHDDSGTQTSHGGIGGVLPDGGEGAQHPANIGLHREHVHGVGGHLSSPNVNMRPMSRAAGTDTAHQTASHATTRIIRRRL